jgi:hypothetical protein
VLARKNVQQPELEIRSRLLLTPQKRKGLQHNLEVSKIYEPNCSIEK